MNRFDLEDAMSRMMDVENEIDDIIYKVGDDPVKPTEDDILNMLIGIKTLSATRYQRMWNIFEKLIEGGTIQSPEQ
jgi:hypothetical protein